MCATTYILKIMSIYLIWYYSLLSLKVDFFGTLHVHLRVMSFLQMVIKNIASTVRETGYESRQNIEVEKNGAVRSCRKLPACACTIRFFVHKL